MDLILASLGLLLSFIFAGSETAFTTANRLRIELWIRNNVKSAIQADKYLSNPDVFLSTTLVGNNIANVLATSYATVYLVVFVDELIAWFLITTTLLLFGEILPKIIFRQHADGLILMVIYPIRVFHFIFNPIIWFSIRVSNLILSIFGMDKKVKDLFITKEDFTHLVKKAPVNAGERKMISKILDLPEITVREAKVPRTSIKAISSSGTVAQARNIMIKSGFSKIPVYIKTIDNIIGVVFMYDLFDNPKTLKEVTKPVVYTPENKKCNELLKEFKYNNTSIAIVVDEYGGTSGLVTLEDLAEVLFGDFEEIPITDKISIQALNKVSWRVQASESVKTINEQLAAKFPEGAYDTIAGLLITRLGHIPREGEQLILNEFRILVTKAQKNKVNEVRIIRRENT
jgi:CBS domain containing-hemolysin-like protein